jgi:hypothetical protein
MRVRLVDVDSKIPNLVLMKLSSFHKAKGDIVGFHTRDPDRVYCSTVFIRNKNKIPYFPPSTEIIQGGSGYDLSIMLPPEIEMLKPDYSLYPDMDYSLGYTSRGCNRDCPFCIVPQKEGKYTRTQPPSQWYSPEFSKIAFLDNNILLDPDWFKATASFCLAQDLKVSFFQGLDIRLVTEDIAEYCYNLNWFKTISFAFDWDSLEPLIREKVDLLKRIGFDLKHEIQFFVYVDSNISFASALHRCNVLRELGTNAYVMFNINHKPNLKMNRLRRWANRRWNYWKVPFAEFEHEINSEIQTTLFPSDI